MIPSAGRPLSRTVRWTTTLVTVGILSLLTGCATTVPMQPARFASDPQCADVIVNLPDAIGDAAIRQTDAQATGAWGTPTVVLLRCGVEVPAPSDQRCVTVGQVDWLIDDSDEDRGVFTTYGRDPAVQVVVDLMVSDSGALNELSDAVANIPADRACTAPEDATVGDDAVLTP